MFALNQFKRISIFLLAPLIIYLLFLFVSHPDNHFYFNLFCGNYDDKHLLYIDMIVLLVPYLLQFCVIETALLFINKGHYNFTAPRCRTAKRLKRMVLLNLSILILFTALCDIIIYFAIGIFSGFTPGVLIVIVLKLFEKLSLGLLTAATDILTGKYLTGCILSGILAFIFILTAFIKAGNAVYNIFVCFILLAISLLFIRVKKNIFIN